MTKQSTRYTTLIPVTAIRGNLIQTVKDLVRRVTTLERSHPGNPGTGAGNLAYFDGDGILDASVGGMRSRCVDYNVSNPPTDAQLDAAFGVTPSEVQAGWTGYVDDNGDNVRLWKVTSNGTSWWYELLTKAS